MLSLYPALRRLLFMLDPEQAHVVALRGLNLAYRLGLMRESKHINEQPISLMGLTFKNCIGLAAGLDLNGEYIDALATLGFGFIEIGGVTPKPQGGNPKPRLFRLKDHQALINRKGFANLGVDAVIHNLTKTNYRGVLGINIAKNKETPAEHAVDDYIYCFQKLAAFASYFSVNVSSPNTPGHRDLQQPSILRHLLQSLKATQQRYVDTHQKYIPLVIKISPDITLDEIKAIAAIFLETKIDGVIATNSSIDRSMIADSPYATEAGGLSGKPLQLKSTAIVRSLHDALGDAIPIIGLGGVMDKTSANEKLRAGASLLQLYTGLIYQGPALVKCLIDSTSKPL